MEQTIEDKKSHLLNKEQDNVAASRKKDHIELAFQSQIDNGTLDQRFYYEPLMAAHPSISDLPSINFLGKKMKAPLWISSMTGGTKEALTINHNLAKACGEFGLGMGLGSCRALLYSDDRLKDFDLRPIMGNDCPFFANLGVAQLEELIEKNSLHLASDMVAKLQADGLIIHVNPFQEWLQPEGDHFKMAPITIIHKCLEFFDFPIIVKEVGQGMGPKSLEALMKLPLAAIDFAASGGTNFAMLELLRASEKERKHYLPLAHQGHSAEEMVEFVNDRSTILQDKIKCHDYIISGGVQNFLDGYYLTNSLNQNAVYGQASAFLKHARGSYDELRTYVKAQLEGLAIANAYLTLRKKEKNEI